MHAPKRLSSYTIFIAVALILAGCGDDGMSFAGTATPASAVGSSSPPSATAVAVGTVPVDTPPVTDSTPATTVTAGQSYQFEPTASDVRRPTLKTSMVNGPVWPLFDTSTGTLFGTLSVVNVGATLNLVITFPDGTALTLFSIALTAPSDPGSQPTSGSTTTTLASSSTTTPVSSFAPPTISGTPVATVIAGSGYSFTPAASDANGNALTFSIQNEPAWASFNTATGQLLGTPASSDVGTFTDIVISASDGQTSSSLPPFTVTVAPNPVYTATLSWTAPTQNTDGSVLTDLSGYIVYYGTNASALDQVVSLNNAGLAAYVVDGLTSGTWYFSVKAVNSSGVESDLSAVVSRTF